MNLSEAVENDAANKVDKSGLVTIYVHGILSDSLPPRDLQQKLATAMAFNSATDEEQEAIYLNWSYSNTFLKNSAWNASDSIGSRNWFPKTAGMSDQDWAAVNKLMATVRRLREIMNNDPCLRKQQINIVAHSQGTVITLAALQAGMHVDNVIFLGSTLDQEVVESNSDNTNLKSAVTKNVGQFYNLWSPSDRAVQFKGGIGHSGLPTNVIGGNIHDIELNGVNHTGSMGWFSGNWFRKGNRKKTEQILMNIIYYEPFRAVRDNKPETCNRETLERLGQLQETARLPIAKP